MDISFVKAEPPIRFLARFENRYRGFRGEIGVQSTTCRKRTLKIGDNQNFNKAFE
jgi:hypothetical protein